MKQKHLFHPSNFTLHPFLGGDGWVNLGDWKDDAAFLLVMFSDC
jgi:hypothetical protein